MLCGSHSSLLLHLHCLLHQMGQRTHSDIALKRPVLFQLLSCPIEAVMNISKDQRSQQCLSSTWRVMQAQLLQSNLSLWEEDLSAVLYHHLVIHEVLTSKPRDTVLRHQREALRWKAMTIQTMPLVISLLGSLQHLFHEPMDTRPLLRQNIVWIAKQTYAENKVSFYLSARSHRKLS